MGEATCSDVSRQITTMGDLRNNITPEHESKRLEKKKENIAPETLSIWSPGKVLKQQYEIPSTPLPHTHFQSFQ